MSNDETPAKSMKVIKIVGIVIALVAAGLLFYFNFRPPVAAPPAAMWFYDTGSKQVVAKPDGIPPLAGQATEVVRAYAYGCTDCADSSKLVVAYLERFTADTAKSLKDGGITTYSALASEPTNFDSGREVRRLKDANWVIAGSDEGQAIISEKVTCPGGEAPVLCVGPNG